MNVESRDQTGRLLGIRKSVLTPRQPLQNHPSGHVGGWATPWSAEEIVDGQHQRVDIPVHARTAHKGLLHKRLEEDLCWIVPHVPRRPDRSGDWTELMTIMTKMLINCYKAITAKRDAYQNIAVVINDGFVWIIIMTGHRNTIDAIDIRHRRAKLGLAAPHTQLIMNNRAK